MYCTAAGRPRALLDVVGGAGGRSASSSSAPHTSRSTPDDPPDGPALALRLRRGRDAGLVFWRRWPSLSSASLRSRRGLRRAWLRRRPGAAAGTAGTARLGYAAPRRVGWIAAAGYVAIAVRRGRLVFGDAEITASSWSLAGWASAAVLAGQAIAARGERAAAERERRAHAQEQALANERLRIARTCTTRSPMRSRPSTCSRASPPTSSTATRRRPSGRSRRSARRAATPSTSSAPSSVCCASRVPSAPRAPITVAPTSSPRRAGPHRRARRDADGPRRRRVASATSVSSAAYRVVQEALTNTRRHAGRGARSTARRRRSATTGR